MKPGRGIFTVLPPASRSARWTAAAALLAAVWAAPVHAGLFDDDEARRAILDLRQKLEQLNEQQRARQAELNTQLLDQIAQLKRSLLELNSQIETLRADSAKLRGADEQLARDVADMQRRVKDVQQGVDDRVRKLEPQKVTLDGKEFVADPEEKRQYDEAIAQLRRADFSAAANALAAFQRRWPASGYSDAVLFWLGNAYYGKREYKEAIASFRSLATTYPTNPRTPEALLAIANCQVELRDAKTARRTLDELVKAYPASEAAQAGRERLASLK